jgi:hypothetical protein
MSEESEANESKDPLLTILFSPQKPSAGKQIKPGSNHNLSHHAKTCPHRRFLINPEHRNHPNCT